MQIENITYEWGISDGSYGNRMLHVTATLSEDEEPAAAALHLRTFVAEQLAAAEQAEQQRAAEEERRRQEQYERDRAARLAAQTARQPADADADEPF